MHPSMESAQLTAVELTRLLKSWNDGDASALERLTPVVYAELHRLAIRSMAGQQQGPLLQPSALVNEAFLRLLGGTQVEWSNRTHFFAVCARMMRQILIDFARAQDAAKRRRDAPHLDLSEIREVAGAQASPVDFLDLDTALNELAELDARQAQVVELRYFGGLENAEVARVLGVSEPTVVRDWRRARAWLFDRLDGPAQMS